MSLPLPVPETQDEPPGFVVRNGDFEGSLAELAQALRSRRLVPAAVDLCSLVRDYLAYYRLVAGLDLDLATQTLPQLARVIELKARLLLPRAPGPASEEEEELLETLEAVALLEDLEEAISFLKRRRDERRIVLPARAPRPDFPRPERTVRIPVGRLAEMASRYRPGGYFELAAPRLTMAAAMDVLMSGLRRLRRAKLRDLLSAQTWEARVMGFAGMLELVKEGKVLARQGEVCGPIELELAGSATKRGKAA